jgi:hypothetical protein
MSHPPRKPPRQPVHAKRAAHHPDERRRALERLVPLWPSEIDDVSLGGRLRLIGVLKRALLSERRRGRAGHWGYDLARHSALLAAWRRERAALETLRRANSLPGNEKGRQPSGQHP